MSNKTLNAIKIVVALLLVAGVGVGLFFGGRWVVNELDSIFDKDPTVDEDGNTKLPGGDTEKPSDSTQTPSDQTQSFYIDERTNTGYSTVGNVTYFFKVFDQTAYMDKSVFTCGFEPYGRYDCCMAYSSDGILWNDFGSYNESSGKYEGQVRVQLLSDKFYVLYTVKTDCSSPLEVLADLNSNVFDNTLNYFYYFDNYLG